MVIDSNRSGVRVVVHIVQKNPTKRSENIAEVFTFSAQLWSGFGTTCTFNTFTQRNNIMNYYKTKSLPLIAFGWISWCFSLLPKKKRSNVLRTIDFGSIVSVNFLILVVKFFERYHFRQNPKLIVGIVLEVNTSPCLLTWNMFRNRN